jgi:hypothetical protein
VEADTATASASKGVDWVRDAHVWEKRSVKGMLDILGGVIIIVGSTLLGLRINLLK